MTRRKNKPTENGEARNKVGQFTGAMPGPGRKRGVPNTTTSVLKEAILIAAANSGDCIAQQMLENALQDGNAIEANGGLVGYLEHIALNFPQQFIPLLGKVLPLVINGSVDLNHKAAISDAAERFTNAISGLAAQHFGSGVSEIEGLSPASVDASFQQITARMAEVSRPRSDEAA